MSSLLNEVSPLTATARLANSAHVLISGAARIDHPLMASAMIVLIFAPLRMAIQFVRVLPMPNSAFAWVNAATDKSVDE